MPKLSIQRPKSGQSPGGHGASVPSHVSSRPNLPPASAGPGHDFSQISVFPASATPDVQRADDADDAGPPGGAPAAGGGAVQELANLGVSVNPGLLDVGGGVIKGGTLVVDQVVSTAYTPGVGNIM